MRHQYDIEGMHCGKCVGKVTAALKSVPDVRAAEVTLNPPRASVEMERHIDHARLAQAVSGAGDYRLKAESSNANEAVAPEPQTKESLYPLFLIVAYIAGTVVLIAAVSRDWSLHSLMQDFMAGFFLVFSFFKLLDLPGFVDAYQSYDIVARRFRAWGFVYPFVELALGVAYLLGIYLVLVNGVTLVLMLVGAIGVLQSLLNKRAIRCACLGTALNLPMTKVTLVEDLGMAAMAGAMLVLLRV
jgi:copper chaperone CopZ